jgi:hypothetical protein
MPTTPDALANNPDLLIQAMTWALMVEAGVIAVLFFGGVKALKWMLERCDIRTDSAWASVKDLADTVKQANELEIKRQQRYER